jgi:transcriptional regulator with XRE-family HTH domain
VREDRIALADLGDALGIAFQQVQKYEKGTNRIGASRLQHIAHAGCPRCSGSFLPASPPSEKAAACTHKTRQSSAGGGAGNRITDEKFADHLGDCFVVECHAGVRKSASNPGGERSGTDRRHGPDAGASQRSSRAFCAVSQPRG